MFGANIKMAVESIRGARLRSIMTTLGIIIGIVSVVTTVSLGQGVKSQVSSQITQLGSNLITIRPGKTVNRDSSGKIVGVNFFAGFGASNLTENDLSTVRKTPNIKLAVPVSFLTGTVKAQDKEFSGGFIIATTEQMPDILNQKISFGEFFSADDSERHVAVIGRSVALGLFNDERPIGQTIQIRGQSFIVRGIFDKFASNPLTPGSDFNSAVFIPYSVGKSLSANTAQIVEILAKTNSTNQTDVTVVTLTDRLKTAHANQEDFTVLKQTETLAITSNILDLLTTFIAGIAAISLIVGGIGVMNVMLATVTERTREIGIRKAIGATNGQILTQFLTEAVILSIFGGLLGISISFLINIILRITSDLQPVITLNIVIIATLVSMIVGMVFGVVPALKAARKDPIEALRYE